ncbi:MAG: hypothetical protein HUU10_11730 [Bacteroidetes bacterium]|nr:hypothetical protein [Bacteroidota bacterium]
MKRLLRYLSWTGLFLLVLLIPAVVWISWQLVRDPLDAIRPGYSLQPTENPTPYSVELPGDIRTYTDYDMPVSTGDTIRWTVSLPDSLSGRIPVVLILGGLEIGRASLTYIEQHGPVALLAYEYPYSPTYWYEGTVIEEIPAIRNAILAVPGQVATIMNWAAGQSWADTTALSVLGYSFGAFFIPASYRLMEEAHLPTGPAVIAYGGSDLYAIIRHNMKKLPDWQRTPVSWLAALSIHPIDPDLYLPGMKAEKLFINGKQDDLIPFDLALRMQAQASGPTSIINLNEGHMHPRKKDLTSRLVRISRDWLDSRWKGDTTQVRMEE